MKYDRNTRIIDLTLGELLDAIAESQQQPQEETIKTKKSGEAVGFVYGLKGLAKLLGCSKTTANRIKQSGKIDEAVTQVGALIVIDAAKALSLLKDYKPKKNKR